MPQEQIREEIKWLESQLETKKKELSGEGKEPREEREMIGEIFREAGAGEKPSPPILSPVTIPDETSKDKAAELKEKEHKYIIEELINLAFEKNLSSALKVANSLKNPHLLDEFHDTLADYYYQKLLEARKIK